MIRVEVDLPVLRSKVLVLIGQVEKKDFPLKSWRMFKNGAYSGRCAYKPRTNTCPATCIIHSKTAAFSVLAHEAVHAANFILDSLGVIADFDNDEIQAYIVQYILEKIEDAL